MSETKPERDGHPVESDEALVDRAVRRMKDQVSEADSRGHAYYPKEVVDDLLLAIGVMFEPLEDQSLRVKHPDQALLVVEKFIKEHGLPKEAASGLESLKEELSGQEENAARAAETTDTALERIQTLRQLIGNAAAALSLVPGQEELVKSLEEASSSKTSDATNKNPS